MTSLLFGAPVALIGALLLLTPEMTRRGMLFAVPVAEEFRSTPEGRRAIARYRAWVAVALTGALLLWTVSPSAVPTGLSPLALLIIGGVAFYRAHQSVTPFAAKESSGERSMDFMVRPERLPGWTWLGIGPFVVLALAAIFLSHHWDSIPATFPMHYGADGVPDRWVDKNSKSVYGILVFGSECCAWLIMMGLAGWYGARRSSLRPGILGLMIFIDYWMAVLFSAMALQPALKFSNWMILAYALCVPPIVIAAFAIRKSGDSSDPPEKTPEKCWRGGILYYNPDDPVLFVEKRMGFGYTMNFANPWNWALFAGLILVLASVRFVMA